MLEVQPKIAIIGGSGLYELLESPKAIVLDTPFGKTPRIDVGTIAGKVVAFLARHSAPGKMERKHEIPPHRINYKANIYGLCMLGVERVLSSSAVGSMDPECPPGTFVIPDQIIDFTSRVCTFYDGETEVVAAGGVRVRGVVHVDVTEPFCPELRKVLRDACEEVRAEYHWGGVYCNTEGPRYETPAEIRMLRMLGGTVVGMTVACEAFLARELQICYATLCLVTNWAAGIAKRRLTADEVIHMFKQKINVVKKVFEKAVSMIPEERKCPCKDALKHAVV